MFQSLMRFPGDTFAELDALQRALERLSGPLNSNASIRAVRGSFPAVNIGTTPEAVQLYAFAPGLDPSSIEVSVDRGLLTIAGTRSGPKEQGDANAKLNVYARERTQGSFRRVISLPEDADPDRVQATYRNGVLHVQVQKREASRPRRIEVREAQ